MNPDDAATRLRPPAADALEAYTALVLAIVATAIVLGAIFARSALTSAVLFLVILLGLVMAHEAAHFFTAKAFGIYVHEFAFGFPPRIFAKRFGDTEYSLNWMPLCIVLFTQASTASVW